MVLADGEQLFPEGESQFRNDLAARRLVGGDVGEVGLRIVVTSAAGLGEAPSEAVRPRPVFAMNAADGFGDAVAGGHLADLQGNDEGSRDAQVPFVEVQRPLAIVRGRLEIGGEAGLGENAGQVVEFAAVEGHV